MTVCIGSIAEQMNPAPMTRLETRRLLLRPMVITDVSSLLQIFSDAKVMASFDAPPLTLGEMEQWVQRNLAHQEANAPLNWMR